MTAPTQEIKMKPNRTDNNHTKQHPQGAVPQPALTTEERAQQCQQDKEFIKAMNEFTAKAGLLSDDPYFGGI
jgi:antitoxin CcdA